MAGKLLYILLAALIIGGMFAFMDSGSVDIGPHTQGGKYRHFYQHDGMFKYGGKGSAQMYPKGPVLYEGMVHPKDCFQQASTYPYSGAGSVGGINAYGTTCGIYASDKMSDMRFMHSKDAKAYSPHIFTGMASYLH